MVNPTGDENHLIPAVIRARSPAGVYQGWAMEFGVSGISEDPDGDGSTNLEEFAWGTHPLEAQDRAPEIHLMVASSGISLGASGVLHPQIEGWIFESDDLTEFLPRERVVIDVTTGALAVTLPLEGEPSRRFFQLRYFLEPFSP